MKNLLDFIRKPAVTAADIKAKLDEIDKAIPAAAAEVERLIAERREKLLVASDNDLRKIEDKIADARRELDRLEVARGLVHSQHSDAKAAEARAALDREIAETAAAADRMVERVQREYCRHAKAIASLVSDLSAAEARVVAINEKLIAAGRATECVPPVEDRAIQFATVSGRHLFRLNTINLPPAPGFPGIGVSLEYAALDGLVIGGDDARRA